MPLLRRRNMTRFCWTLKQVWYYFIIIYLAFTCFYVLNIIFPSDDESSTTTKDDRRRQKHRDNTRAVSKPEAEAALEHEDDDFLGMFPDPKLHLNPLQMRHRREQQSMLEKVDLEANQRKQLEKELKRQEYEQNLKFWTRAQLGEDIARYNFTKSRTKKRVDIIAKIRWRIMREHSVSIKDLEDMRMPQNMGSYFRIIRKKMNTDQSFEYFYKPFKLRRPAFISDVERRIFLKDKENERLINGLQSHEEFRGYVDIYKDGVISEKLECGYQGLRRRFMEYTTGTHVNVRSIDQVVCPLLVPDSKTFHRFIDGVLPKLIQAYDIVVPNDVVFLIYPPRDENILFLYDRLGIDRSRLVYHHGGIWHAKAVVDVCNTPPLHASLFRLARKAFGSLDNLTIPLSQANVIFISRENALNFGRRVKNRAEVIGTLYNRYKENLKVLSDVKIVRESVSLFKNAKIIIGVHGGGLYNIIFAPSGTSIIEIMPTDRDGEVCRRSGRLTPRIFWNLAAMLEQKYWRIIEEPKMNCDVKVDIKKLEKALDFIDEKHRKQQMQS